MASDTRTQTAKPISYRCTDYDSIPRIDAKTGAPRLWHGCKDANGLYRLYENGPGFDPYCTPTTKLEPLTEAVDKDIRDQLAETCKAKPETVVEAKPAPAPTPVATPDPQVVLLQQQLEEVRKNNTLLQQKQTVKPEPTPAPALATPAPAPAVSIPAPHPADDNDRPRNRNWITPRDVQRDVQHSYNRWTTDLTPYGAMPEPEQPHYLRNTPRPTNSIVIQEACPPSYYRDPSSLSKCQEKPKAKPTLDIVISLFKKKADPKPKPQPK
jgi:hypothetical protein